MQAEQIEAVADLIARVVQPLTARLAVAEAQVAALTALAARVETVDARVQDLASKDLGALRERVAIVETRAPLPGPPGKDGRDGLDLKDLQVGHDGRRRLTFKLGEAEAQVVTFAGLPFYEGVWAPSTTYEQGDLVTWAGGAWHCAAATTTNKPGESPDWVLMVKRGRDGKDAVRA